MGEISFKVIEDKGLIAIAPTGWEKRLRIVSWNDNKPKFDIRDWEPDERTGEPGVQRMSKGLTLTRQEMMSLHNLLIDIYGPEKVEINEEV